MKLSLPRRDLGAIYSFIILPVISYFLLIGSPALGLPIVTTNLWGGLLVTVVVSAVGIVVSMPLGILLALGRRSN
ncbi:MAG: amino acid ABC transporter permease, partial [Hyphomicrobiales bacterium]|nr:amino acid ABC transporter permease [Hyphomicrobiales bacterium]